MPPTKDKDCSSREEAEEELRLDLKSQGWLHRKEHNGKTGKEQDQGEIQTELCEWHTLGYSEETVFFCG